MSLYSSLIQVPASQYCSFISALDPAFHGAAKRPHTSLIFILHLLSSKSRWKMRMNHNFLGVDLEASEGSKRTYIRTSIR